MRVGRLLGLVATLVLCYSTANAYTVTFDGIPSGSGLDYYNALYGITFTSGFSVVERVGFANSGTNVLVWDAYSQETTGFIFADGLSDTAACYPLHYTARSVGAYFSTGMGVVIRMIGYKSSKDLQPVADILIGTPIDSWSNRYRGISSEAGNIGFVTLQVVDLPHGQGNFCVDDLTVNPVPEPSALATLLIGIGGLVWRRKK